MVQHIFGGQAAAQAEAAAIQIKLMRLAQERAELELELFRLTMACRKAELEKLAAERDAAELAGERERWLAQECAARRTTNLCNKDDAP